MKLNRASMFGLLFLGITIGLSYGQSFKMPLDDIDSDELTKLKRRFYYSPSSVEIDIPKPRFYSGSNENVKPQSRFHYGSDENVKPQSRFYYDSDENVKPKYRYYYGSDEVAKPKTRFFYTSEVNQPKPRFFYATNSGEAKEIPVRRFRGGFRMPSIPARFPRPIPRPIPKPSRGGGRPHAHPHLPDIEIPIPDPNIDVSSDDQNVPSS